MFRLGVGYLDGRRRSQDLRGARTIPLEQERPLPLGSDDFVFALHEAARKRSCLYMAQARVSIELTEQRDAGSDQDGDAGDDESVDEAGGEETLDGLAAIDIEVAEPAGIQPSDDLGRGAYH